jgi:hypothetical protein
MAGLSRALTSLALVGIGAVACGSRSALYVQGAPGTHLGQDGGEDGGEDAGLDAELDAPTDVGPDAPQDAPACMSRPITLTLVAPNLYFVLDHSTSMRNNNKWQNVRDAVSQIIGQIGAGARFGATMFPGVQSANSCDPGVEVMSLRQGDSRGAVQSTFLNVTAADPNGGTPTAATLENLIPTLSGLAGTTYAILATDGGPNCNSSLSCSADQCTSNIDGQPSCPSDGSVNCCAFPNGSGSSCLDQQGAIQAAADLAAAGVQIFVLGISGSAPYGPVLDGLAKAGGTARPSEPLYYRVDTPDTAALSGAFQQIVARTGAGCTFTLARLPTTLVGVRVVLDGMAIPATGPNRWSISGNTLTLLGTSCAAVQSAGAPSLQFFDGCAR